MNTYSPNEFQFNTSALFYIVDRAEELNPLIRLLFPEIGYDSSVIGYDNPHPKDSERSSIHKVRSNRNMTSD